MAAFEVIALDTATPQLRAPGASDTYTFPRAVELPLGTANGVAFLNASKVLTTGSALTFDGQAVSLTTGASQFVAKFPGGVQQMAIGSDGSSGAYVGTLDNYPVRFLLNSSEQMRLTSTGLGIGTSSPTDRLHVVGTASRFDKSNGVAVGQIRLLTATDSYASAWALGQPASSTNFAVQYFNGSSWSDAVTVNTSGNLGLGVTPSAWGNGVSMQGSGWALSTTLGTDCGAYYVNARQTGYAGIGSSCVYRTTAPAGAYGIESATHKWFTAPSGTAGNTISFVQAMTLAASGNLLIGTTTESGTGRLRVAGEGVRIADLSTETNALLISSSGTASTIETRYTTPIILGTNATERARIASGGDFQTASGNSVMVGGTAARATTAGTNRVDIFDGTAPVGTLANGVSFYSASGEANVMDAAGNATLLSPHDAETNEWIFRSKHTPTGKVLKIDVERLLKFVNDHFGLDAVHEFVEV